MTDKDLIKSLIKDHNMEPHPEGGHYVEVFRNDNVTHIYFLLEEHENLTGTESQKLRHYIFTLAVL